MSIKKILMVGLTTALIIGSITVPSWTYPMKANAEVQSASTAITPSLPVDGTLLPEILPPSPPAHNGKTDRYIIKYKDNASRDAVQTKLKGKYKKAENLDYKPSKSKKNNENGNGKHNGATKGNKGTGKNSNVSQPTTDDTTTMMDVYQLNAKESFQDFQSELDNLGVSDQIESVQPDYELSLDSVDGTVSLEVVPDDSTVSDEPTAGADTTVNETPGATTDTDGTRDGVVNSPTDGTDTTLDDASGDTTTDNATIDDTQLDSPTIVAIIDTGVDITHPALKSYIWVNPNEASDGIDNDGNGFTDDIHGWDFTKNNNQVYSSDDPLDYAHGTHVAGIITQTAAENDANIQIMPIKVFRDGKAYTSDVINAIIYARKNGAQIINCSFGTTEENPALKEAIQDSPDLLFVSAAGNSRSDLSQSPIYPASYPLANVISVASTNADGGFSYYSNYSHDIVDIAALGRDVLSTLPGGKYGTMTGTSMSAAEVTGAAAVLALSQPDLSADQLKDRLVTTADTLTNLQNKVIGGKWLDLSNALAGIVSMGALDLNPADDFDVDGYEPTLDEEMQLYSAAGNITQIAAGMHFTLVLKSNGTVWAWGYNHDGECGCGRTSDTETLTQVVGLTNVIAIKAGYADGLALKSDGTVWAWGFNVSGELGDGTTVEKTVPIQVIGLSNITAISAGGYGSMALKSDGTVWAWGGNNYGQLGNGTTTQRTTPGQVSGLSGVTAIVNNVYVGMALKNNGTVWAWGNNDYGQVGDGTTTQRTTPVQVIGLSGITNISIGTYHGIVLKSDGTVWTWGRNSNGQLGNGTTTDNATAAMAAGLSGITAISAGAHHNLAMKNDGTLWAWGYNYYGQLGNGKTLTQSATPVLVSGFSGVTQIAGGGFHSLALKNDGTLWAWGYNYYGQLGDGTAIDRSTPVQSILTDQKPDNATASVSITSSPGKTFSVFIKLSNYSTFSGKTFSLKYDTSVLEIADFAAQTSNVDTGAVGAVTGTPITITSSASGTIQFTVNKTVPAGKLWSGVLSIVRFKGKTSASTSVTIQ